MKIYDGKSNQVENQIDMNANEILIDMLQMKIQMKHEYTHANKRCCSSIGQLIFGNG